MTTPIRLSVAAFAAAVVIVNADAEDFRRVAFQTAKPAVSEIKVDGVLDDEAWQDADWNDRYYEFLKANPGRKFPGTANAIVYTKEALYVGIRNPEEFLSKMRRSARRNHHGVTWCDDCAELYVDPEAKGIGFYKFVVNSLGCFDDEWQMDRANCFHDWNSEGVQAAAHVDEANKIWTIEIMIPWNDLGQSSPPKPGDLWMFNHNRFRYTTRGWGDFASSAPEAAYHCPDKFGYLLFSDGSLPDRREIGRRVAERLKLSWFMEFGDETAFNDADGLHFATSGEFQAKRDAEEKAMAEYRRLIPAVQHAFNALPPADIPERKEQPKPTAYDGHNGYYLHHLQRTYPSPHFDWGRDLEDAPEIMFGVSYYGSRMRHVYELLQRVDLGGDVFTTFWGQALGGHGAYDDPISGGTPNEAEARFGNLLRKRPDVVSFWDFKFANLRPDFRYEILRRMKDEGLGLLLIEPPWGATSAELKKLERLPEEEAAITALAPYQPSEVRVYRFGKGRFVHLYGLKDRNWDPDWAADWERRNAFMGRVFLAAAQKLRSEITVLDRSQKSVTVQTKFAKDVVVEWRIRDVANRVVASGTRGGAVVMDFDVSALPAGEYTLDLITKTAGAAVKLGLGGGKTREFGYVPFTKDSAAGDFELLAPEFVDEHGAFTAEAKWTTPVRAAKKLLLSLRDLPHRNLRWQSVYEVGDDATSVMSGTIRDYPVDTRAGLLEAQLLAGDGTTLDSAWKLICFPDADFPVYPQINWQDLNVHGMLPFNGPRMVDEWGWNGNLCEGGPFSAYWNARGLPCIGFLRMGAWGNGAVRGTLSASAYNWNGKLIGEAQKRCGMDENPFKADVRNELALILRERTVEMRKYGHVAYNLGDECYFSTDAGFAESDRRIFPQFLERKYGSIKNYNAIRGTNFTSFAEVPHLKLKAARDAGDTQSWFDQVQYAEAIYAEAMHLHNREIMKHDPFARVGAEGSVPGDLEQTISGLKFWGPYKSQIQNELLREVSAPEVLRGVWWGGYVNEPRDGLIRLQWGFMLAGTSNCNLWYTAENGSTMGIANGAFEPAPYFIRELPHLEALRWGGGQQLVVSPLLKQGLGILYSHESNHAASLDERLSAPGASQNAFLQFCYRHGYGIEMLSKTRLGRFDAQKTIVVAGGHALTDAEIAALKAFAKKGGRIVYDVTPCTFTSWMTYRKPSDNPLAGTGAVLGASFAERLRKLRGDVAKFDAELTKLLADRGVKPLFDLAGTEEAPRTMMRVRELDGGKLVGILFPKEADGREFSLSIAGGAKRHVYRVDGGYLGELSEIGLRAADYPWYQFSVFPFRQQAPAIGLGADVVQPGQTVSLDAKPLRGNGVYRVEVLGPGMAKPWKDVYCVKDGSRPWKYNFALDCAKGEYVFRLVDVATGLASEKTVVCEDPIHE